MAAFMWLGYVLAACFEGQGPEHSPARLERFIQLAAQHNIQICIPTTPAQVFHMLRRQRLRQYRKPLVVSSGKVFYDLLENDGSWNWIRWHCFVWNNSTHSQKII